MIKQLKKSDVAMSPFTTTKAWELFNIENDAGLLVETSSLVPDEEVDQIALDYIDYNIGPNPILNRECNIALEQQTEDQLMFEEGISSSYKFFDTASQPRNNSGTYKSLLYTQISNAFYNHYRNPTQIFGMDNIDFPLNKTNRWLADNFRMFTIPRMMFGEKLVEGSIRFYDTAFDDNVDIYDDRVGNLVAADHLFSKVQEIRRLGNDIVAEGTASYACSLPSGDVPVGVPTITAIQTGTPAMTPYITASQQ